MSHLIHFLKNCQKFKNFDKNVTIFMKRCQIQLILIIQQRNPYVLVQNLMENHENASDFTSDNYMFKILRKFSFQKIAKNEVCRHLL
jgi:hypothetical protein